jgi:hypothetical protein
MEENQPEQQTECPSPVLELTALTEDKLRSLKRKVKEELSQRKRRKIHENQCIALEAFYDLWFAKAESLVKEDHKVRIAESMESDEDQDHMTNLLRDAYFSLGVNDRWGTDDVKLRFGEKPPCQSDECWWWANMDRLSEYDGEIHYPILLPEHAQFCEVCRGNGCGDDVETEHLVFNDYLEDFYAWFHKKRASDPK